MDILRDEAKAVIKALHKRGIKRIVMLTGDNPRAARAIAMEAGVDAFVASALPETKENYIKKLQSEGHAVVVVGDGI
ncbi:MAG: HAD-IC family P-type ATPase [Candidatus Omnitrophica bacterium]|nr:HAD-IC family P-type ATPase [Candidatus Omnitrophota bacterium]